MSKVLRFLFTLSLILQLSVLAASAQPMTTLLLSIRPGVVPTAVFVDAAGVEISQPRVSMTVATVSFTEQELHGSLSDILLQNPTDQSSWVLSLAPAGSTAATWTSNTGASMAYDDPTAGQLTVDLTQSQLALSQSGLQGISVGRRTSFEAGAVQSITLFTAGIDATTFSQFQFTGVKLYQRVPAVQPAGTYTLRLMLTLS